MQMPALAHAQTSQVSTRSAITNPTTLNWISLFGAIDPILNPTASVAGTAGPLTVTVSGPGKVATFQQGITWGGVFSFGDPVLFSAGSGPLKITFSQDVFAFGANVQSNLFGDFLATITAYDASNTKLSPSVSQSGSFTTIGEGFSAFLGIQSTTGFRAVTIDVSGNLINPDSKLPDLSLGINQATITTAPRTTVPEPGTYALTVAGLAGVLLVSRRRRRLHA
jgi:hypothetical protein